MGKSKKEKGLVEESTTEPQSTEEESDIPLDFAKPSSKDFLPDEIKNWQPDMPCHDGSCCSDEEEEGGAEDGENPDFFADGSTASNKKDEGSYTKKVLAFIMLFPMIVTAITMMSDVASKFNIDKTAMQITATLGGAGIALFILSKVPQLREAVKFVLCFAWVIFLLPTYQVYSCSPIEMKNSMLGTWFKLSTSQNDFLEKTYITSECFNKMKLQSPYMMSALSLKVSLVIHINDLIQLDEQEEKGGTKYFLAVSKRSVKKKFHKLYLIIEVGEKEAQLLSKSLKLTNSEKDKHLLVATGAIQNLEDELLPMKKELEKMQYLMRPIKFKVATISYRDKYARFKPMHDESLY